MRTRIGRRDQCGDRERDGVSGTFGNVRPVTIIGPVTPYRGGIVQHTDHLIAKLNERGLEVHVESWRNQYPRMLYRGELPKIEELKNSRNRRFALSWANPLSWIKAGLRARGTTLILVAATSLQYPMYVAVLLAVGKQVRGSSVLIVHNVQPHERPLLTRPLSKLMFKVVGKVVVHGHNEAKRAAELGAETITCSLPAHMEMPAREAPDHQVHKRILFFGFVRHYKGLDLLLRALADIPDVQLIVAGQFWESKVKYDSIIDELNLNSRCELFDRFISIGELQQFLDQSDAVVMPYRSGTASQLPLIARQRKVPVIVTNVGDVASAVRHKVDGLVVEQPDVCQIRDAIEYLYQPEVLRRLRQNVDATIGEESWEEYIHSVLGNG